MNLKTRKIIGCIKGWVGIFLWEFFFFAFLKKLIVVMLMMIKGHNKLKKQINGNISSCDSHIK